MSITAPTPSRVFEHNRLWQLTRPAMLHACDLLATAVQRLTSTAQMEPISAVVGIANGGTTPARHIAASFGLHAQIVRARHNATDTPYSPATGTVTCDLTSWQPTSGGRLGGTVLVVDDICGTGATFTSVLDELRLRADDAVRFVTCALCCNRGTPTPPDVYCWDVADWVVFPWETVPEDQLTTPLPTPNQVICRA